MTITLIGMSNCGKSYWSRKLEEAGFIRFSCDDFIEKKLEKELKRLGFSGVNDVAKWMGQPYEERYSQTSKKYLAFESDSLEEIIYNLEHAYPDQNYVVDTTGSVIYTNDKIMEQLSKLTTIIYLETPLSVRQEMCELYFRNPKPVIWGESFKKFRGEENKVALKRCYPTFLDYRCKKYKKHTQITLDYFLLRSPGFTINNFLGYIQRNYDSISEYQRIPQTL